MELTVLPATAQTTADQVSNTMIYCSEHPAGVQSYSKVVLFFKLANQKMLGQESGGVCQDLQIKSATNYV